MDDKYIWYMGDGTLIKGSKAKAYIGKRQKKLNRLMTETADLINQMKKFNTSDTVIGDEEVKDDTSRLMETLENLSVVEMLCERLLNQLRKELHDD